LGFEGAGGEKEQRVRYYPLMTSSSGYTNSDRGGHFGSYSSGPTLAGKIVSLFVVPKRAKTQWGTYSLVVPTSGCGR
jgi:hypothetical protein